METARMISNIASANETSGDILFTRENKIARDSSIFFDIHHEEINIAIWQRKLSSKLKLDVKAFLKQQPSCKLKLRVTPRNAIAKLSSQLGSNDYSALEKDIAELIELYCRILDIKQVDLRLTALNDAMCPRFHTDNVPCRLLTTYQGIGTLMNSLIILN